MIRVALTTFALSAPLCACGPRPAFEGLQPLPAPPEGNAVLGDFAASLELTDEIVSWALRRPEPSALVDAEVDAMLAYVHQHGRWQLELFQQAASARAERRGARWQLVNTALQLFPYLELDTGPRQLAVVAIDALRSQLGDDAVYREAKTAPRETSEGSDFLPELRDGVAILSLGHIDAGVADRILAVLSQWAQLEPLPRAVLLDLTHAEFEDGPAVSRVFGAFAPEQPLLELVYRSSDNHEVQRNAWGGAATGWSLQRYTSLPLFAVTSAQTGALATAFAHALRHRRAARVLGDATPGTGRGFHFQELPWHASFGFTVYDIVGSDGQPLAGRPVIPDVCWGERGLAMVPQPTLAALRAACPQPNAELDRAAVLDYVRQRLAAAVVPERGTLTHLQYGEEHG